MKVLLFAVGALLCVEVALGKNKIPECSVKGRGKLTTWSNTKVYVRIPCKYLASDFQCGNLRVRAAPTMALDPALSKYYTDALWLSVTDVNTKDTWRGRINNMRMEKFFNESSDDMDPFRTAMETPAASFKVRQLNDEDDYSATVYTGDLTVTFFGYKDWDKKTRKRNGVSIQCESPVFNELSEYPESMCGNLTDNALGQRDLALGIKKHSNTITHDILMNENVYQLPQCEIAVRAFGRCEDRAETIRSCAPLLEKTNTMKCLGKYNRDPMDAFIYCLRYKCDNNYHAFNQLQAFLDGCPHNRKVPSGPEKTLLLPGESCVAPNRPNCQRGSKCDVDNGYICRILPGKSCAAPHAQHCGQGTVCDANTEQCVLAPGQDCSALDSGICDSQSQCEQSGVCKRSLGSPCAAPFSDQCASGLQCDVTTSTCVNIPTTTTTTSTTTTTTSTTTPTPAIASTAAAATAPLCAWEDQAGVYGSNYIKTLTRADGSKPATQDDCKVACEEKPGCVAVDYGSGGSCDWYTEKSTQWTPHDSYVYSTKMHCQSLP